jgi:hypothetical protein
MIKIDPTQIITAEQKKIAARAVKFDDLARVRWERETGGIEMPGGGLVRTDRETRASLVEALNSLDAGLMSEPIVWKLQDGWVDLTGDYLREIIAAVSAHVKACYAAERSVSILLAAAPDPASYDVASAFEAAYSVSAGQ